MLQQRLRNMNVISRYQLIIDRLCPQNSSRAGSDPDLVCEAEQGRASSDWTIRTQRVLMVQSEGAESATVCRLLVIDPDHFICTVPASHSVFVRLTSLYVT